MSIYPGPSRWPPEGYQEELRRCPLTVIQKLEDIDRRLNALDCKVEEAAKRKFKAKLRKRANSKAKR